MTDTRGLWRGKTMPKENSREFNNVWVKGNLIQSRGSYYIHPKANSVNVQGELGQLVVMHEVDPSTLGECTGQPDKKDRIAFEGDLINSHFGGNVGVIRYGEYKNPFNDDEFTKHIGFYVEWLSGNDKDMLRMDLGYWLPAVEIVGNIHDNPEMLKAADIEDIGNAAQDVLLPVT